MNRTFALLSIAVGAFMGTSRASAESIYLPLHIGNQWNYDGGPGVEQVVRITGTRMIQGSETFVLTHTGNPVNLGLENYWTTGAEGDVLLWGFFRSNDNFGVLYYPPIPLVDEPLSQGKTWSHTANLTRLPDMMDLGPFTFDFEVYSEAPLSVPAGVFHAFGIGQRAPAAGFA